MNQFLPIAAVIATCSFFLISAAPIDEANSRVDVIVVENVTDYLKTAPEVFDLVRLEKTNLTRTQIRYTAGRRVGGDRVVASNVGNQSWGVAQDVALTLAYPANGVGAIVSYIEIIVNQTSNSGQSYIVAGGIGQRRITIVVEAYRTLQFNYNSLIYGY